MEVSYGGSNRSLPEQVIPEKVWRKPPGSALVNAHTNNKRSDEKLRS